MASHAVAGQYLSALLHSVSKDFRVQRHLLRDYQHIGCAYTSGMAGKLRSWFAAVLAVLSQPCSM